jgi:hypothetical protein
MLFLTDHRDRPAKAGGSQRFRGTSARLAGAASTPMAPEIFLFLPNRERFEHSSSILGLRRH